MEVKVADQEAHVQRVMRNTPWQPLFQRVRNFTGHIDRGQISRFQPRCSVSIDARGSPTGSEDQELGLRWFSIDFITCCLALDDQEVTDLVHKQILAPFMEDLDVLEAQQRLIDNDTRQVPEASLKAAFGSVAARRIVQRLMGQDAK